MMNFGKTHILTSGMKLPNAGKAVVEREKIVDYLLNAAHPYGASKARFFAGFGLQREKWEQLALSLRRHGQTHEVKRTRQTGFGPRYEVEGDLKTPDGRSPRVRSVWQLDQGELSRRACATLDYRVSFGRVMKIKEHDCVVLTSDLPSEQLKAGDVGTVIHIHKSGAAYEVEFTTLDGRTLTVATVESKQVRPVSRRDVAHVRVLQAA